MEFKSWSISMRSINAANTCSMFLTSKNELFILEKNISLHCYFLFLDRDPLDVKFSSLVPCGKVETASIAYDCNSDASYLLLGNPLQIYDTNDLSTPVYPQRIDNVFRGKLGTSPTTFATNNSLFISTLDDGTIKFDLSTRIFEPVSKMYLPLAGHYYQVTNGKKYEFWKGQKQVTVTDLHNGNQDKLILDSPAMDPDEHPMAACPDGFYFWDCHKGVLKIDLTGQITTFVDINAIDNASDYQCLFHSVRNLTVNQNKIFALGIPTARKILILRPNSTK